MVTNIKLIHVLSVVDVLVFAQQILGKKLSPRKIMMDTRDRIEEIVEILIEMENLLMIIKNCWMIILQRELWACTSCNACVECQLA